MAFFQSAPPSYLSVASPSTTKEIKLWHSGKLRQKYEFMAELYAIIMTVQHLEKAFIRDAITADQYEEECTKLIGKFKVTEASLTADGTIKDTHAFIQEHHMHCPAAEQRLLVDGVPSTVVHAQCRGSSQDTVLVSEATQLFITALDALKLDQRAVDDIQPLMSDLCKALSRMDSVMGKGGFVDKAKVTSWLRTLNSMRAIDELDEDQARQLVFDLERCYEAFMSKLKGH